MMRRTLFLAFLLVTGLAAAQGLPRPSSGSSVTIASGIGSSPAAAGMTLSAGTLTLQPADATHPGIVTTGAQTIAGNKTLTGNLVMSASQIKGTWTTPQLIDMNYGSNGIRFGTGSNGGGDFIFTDLGQNTYMHSAQGGLWVTNLEHPVPFVHRAQTAVAQAIEFGSTALSSGAATATFARAFTAAPKCICQDTTAAATVQCSTSTTTLTLANGTGTDSITWFCIGAY